MSNFTSCSALLLLAMLCPVAVRRVVDSALQNSLLESQNDVATQLHHAKMNSTSSQPDVTTQLHHDKVNITSNQPDQFSESLVNVTTKGLSWNCPEGSDEAIESVSTYCCWFNPFASHCLTVVNLESGSSAVLELYGVGNASPPKAHIDCHVTERITQQNFASELADVSWLFEKGVEGGYHPFQEYGDPKHPLSWGEARPKPEPKNFIGGYNSPNALGSKGYTQQRYDMTMSGLLDWVKDYKKAFPDYIVLKHNCQKFSAGIYNAISHSSRWTHQSKLTATGRAVGMNL